MTNNPELIEEIKKQIRQISKEELTEIVNKLEIKNTKEDFDEIINLFSHPNFKPQNSLKIYNTLLEVKNYILILEEISNRGGFNVQKK